MVQAQGEGLVIHFVEKAHIGRRKKEQQDFQGHLILPADPKSGRPILYLFVVADGVSMGMAGALASRTAVEHILVRFAAVIGPAGQETDPAVALELAFKAAADEVAALAEDRPGMATTCSATLLVGNRVVTAHVGDSRVYLASISPEPQVASLGIDHSWVEEAGRALVRSGHMNEADLLTDPRRHTITRALGMEGQVYVDFNSSLIQAGDLVLVCSDGLWDLIEPKLLEDLLLTASTDLSQLNQAEDQQNRLQSLADQLEEAAMTAGGRDNITLATLLIVQSGPAYQLPLLPQLVAETRQDVAERTGLSPSNPLVENIPTPPSFRPYQPLIKTNLIKEIGPAPGPFNAEAVFSKSQKLFALGHWDEAFEGFLQIEKQEPSYHNLFEVVSNALLRYTEGAMMQDQRERIVNLFSQIDQAGISRYDELLFDFCLEESRKASQNRDYTKTKAYADFAAQLKPQDGRSRNLQELAELYLALSQPKTLPLEDRLALAQKIYARDEDFGAIQDDLALIYMEMGDEAAREGAENDALNWYELIRPLRPSDSRLVSLSANKQRAMEDALMRREAQTSPAEIAAIPLVERPSHAALNRSRENGSRFTKVPFGLESDSEGGESRPEAEVINRLRERVSRAQKAWDAGRKEVGVEYIYLVEQLSAAISPNPWQPTFPRVCYDYGKWLLDQKQYVEARPYFHKAQVLGMAAAQQRVNEIDRILKEQGGYLAASLDLPDNASARKSWGVSLPRTSLATTGEQESASSRINPLVVPATGTRQPLIQRRAEAPADTTFVGTTHAGDGVLNPAVPALEESQKVPGPLSAAALAAGNTSSNGGGGGGRAEANSGRYDKPERMVGVSGTLRKRDNEANPMQGAASREVSRLQTQGLPQATALPEVVRRRQLAGILNLLSNLTPFLIIGIVVIVALVGLFVIINLVGSLNLGKNNEQANATSLASTVAVPTVTLSSLISSTTDLAYTATPAAVPILTPASVVARLEGISASEVRVFLAVSGELPTVYRERELTFDSNSNAFRLPQPMLDKLDPKLKYILLTRPKDTLTRKYQADIMLDAPLQTLWTRTELTFVPGNSPEVLLKIPAEATNFYPLDSGEQDLDLPGGGRYYKMTHHNVRGDFFRAYADIGGVNRYGYPISEEFDWKDVGTVQFFERGWLIRSSDGKLVRIGKLGQTVLEDPDFDNTLKPPPSVGSAGYKIDTAFTTDSNNNRYGKPLSAAFEISSGNTKKKVQYFELARLETDSTNKNSPVTLGLLGTEYARARNWLR